MELSSLWKVGGLQKRWLRNTISVVIALGLVCVLAVTATFAAYYYSNMQRDMNNRARTAMDFFADYIDQSYDEYYRSCILYAQTYEDKDSIELQFINTQGDLIASSYGQWLGTPPATPEIADAVSSRGPVTFTGRNVHTDERIIAVSTPIIYINGEVIGVL